ncbi:uncharacterized protein LOC135681198 isoform X2 [Rhopilema esculentum]
MEAPLNRCTMLRFLIAIVTVQITASTDQYYRHINGQCRLRFPPYRDGYCFRSSACPGAVISSLCPQHSADVGCCILEYYPSYGKVSSNITIEMFKAVFNETIRSQAQFVHFLRSLEEAKVTSCHQQSAYLTQIAFDTNFLSTMEEVPKDLNLKSKNELKYIGRGAIHIAGESFYRWLHSKIHKPVIEKPEILSFPSLSYRSAAMLWANSYSPTKNSPLSNVSYNELANGSKYGFLLQSYLLRGHLNEVDRLLAIWRKVNKALNCDCEASEGPKCNVNGRDGKCMLVSDCKGKQAVAVNQCFGPTNLVQCCLGFYGPIHIQAFVKQDIWQRYNVTKTILKTLEHTASTQDSRFTIKAFTERLALNKTATGPRKVDLPLNIYLDNQNGPNETTQENSQKDDVTGFQKKIAVVITDYNEVANDKLKLWIDGTAWSPSVLILQIVDNNRIIGQDGIIKQRFEAKAAEIRDKLKEKIYSGPWFLPFNTKLRVDLEKHETTLLAIPHDEHSTLKPVLSVEAFKGASSVTGISHMSDLDISTRSHCHNKETNNTKKHSDNRLKQQKIVVQYISSPLQSKNTTETIETIVLNSKAIIMLRGVGTTNIARVLVSFQHVSRKSGQLKGTDASLLIAISHLTVALSCIIVLSLFKLFMFSSTETELTVNESIETHGNNDNLSSSGAASFHMYFSSSEHGEFNIHPTTVEKYFDEKAAEDCNIACENIETKRYNQTPLKSFKLSCILMFNFVLACSIFNPQSKHCLLAIKFMQRYLSNMTYLWLICEISQTSEGRIKTFDYTNRKRCFHLILWGVPAVLCLIPYVFRITIDQPLDWPSIDAYIDVFSTGFLFVIATCLWTVNLIMGIQNKSSKIPFSASMILLLLNGLFTAVWGMATFQDYLQHFHWYQLGRIIANFALAAFVFTSVCSSPTQTYIRHDHQRMKAAPTAKDDV